MAQDNGGFLNFDLDKLLGVTPSPVQPLLSNPERLESNKDIGGGLGLLAPIISGYGRKSAPEILLESYIGAGKGRQGAVDTETNRFMKQQDIMKKMGEYQKLQGDIAQQPYDLQSKKVKSILDTSKLDAMKIYVNTLPPMKAAELAIDPDKFFSNNKVTEEERMLYTTLGIEDRFKIPKEKAGMVTYFNQLSDQKDVDAHNAEENRKAQDPLYKPNYLTNGKLDFIKRLQATNNNSNANITSNQQLEQQDVPEGMVKTANKKIMSEEDFNALPYREKEYLDPDLDIDTFRKRKLEVINGRQNDKKMIGYGMSGNRDVAQNIEKILDDPKALNELFTQTGRMRVRFNDATNGFVAEGGGVAADVARYLNSLKAKQFTQQIQFMRQNNPTGGAVGNVSDREVSMFQNMQEYLGDMGSGEKLYEALVDLYNKTEVMNSEYKDFYIDDYGTNYWDESLQNREIKFKQYAPTLQQAIRKKTVNELQKEVDGNTQPTKSIFQLELDKRQGK